MEHRSPETGTLPRERRWVMRKYLQITDINPRRRNLMWCVKIGNFYLFFLTLFSSLISTFFRISFPHLCSSYFFLIFSLHLFFPSFLFLIVFPHLYPPPSKLKMFPAEIKNCSNLSPNDEWCRPSLVKNTAGRGGVGNSRLPTWSSEMGFDLMTRAIH